MTGPLLVRLAAAGAVMCYALRLGLDVLGSPNQESRSRWARICWTAGALLLTIHILLAFHFQHAWSHAAAWEHVRKRTLELTGWDSGAGLYANYATTAIWLIDVLGWWNTLGWPRRYRGWFWFVQVWLAFLMVNATIVFGPWYWTPVVVVFVFLSALGSQRLYGRR